MKINVTLQIDIDPQAWAQVYGLNESTPATVRMDVREYAYHQVQQSPGIQESGAEVTLK